MRFLPTAATFLLLLTRFDYLLRRTTVGSSPAQASYLETTAVPSVEAVFYQDARGVSLASTQTNGAPPTTCPPLNPSRLPAGDRVKYADASTFKLRLKRVFAEKAGSGGSGATGLTPLSSSFAAGAPPSPALSHSGSFAALPPRSSTPLRGLPVVDTAAAVPPAGASVRPSFAASDTLSGVSSRSPLRQELPRDRSRLAGTETLPRQQQLLLSGSEGPPRPDSRSSFASPAAQSRSLAPPGSGSSVSRSGTRQRGSDVSAAAPAHRDSALSALTGVTEEQVSSPYQAGDTSAGPRWGGAPHPWARLRGVVIRHFPAQADGAVRLALVLERRPSEPPVLKLLNKWQHRQCSECGAMQTTGLGLLNTGLPAQYCHYTELLFCERCSEWREGWCGRASAHHASSSPNISVA